MCKQSARCGDDEKHILRFEEAVCAGIRSCGITLEQLFASPAAVGVSGGADSMALLVSLLRLKKRFGTESALIHAVTVNHNIRSAEESAGDASFVQNFCAAAGAACTVLTVPRGKIAETARERGKGIEEAARFIRYGLFESFCRGHGISVFFLAHTQNDQLETLLLRFLQGSDVGSLSGIAPRRGVFCRPLLGVPRAEIETYLQLCGVSYRTDATNSDPSYLRNRIRLELVPLLNASFPGWRCALLAGSEKALQDARSLERLAAGIEWETDALPDCVRLSAAVFFAADEAVRRRLLYRAFSLLHIAERVPYQLVRTALLGEFPVRGKGVELTCENGAVQAKRWTVSRKTPYFFVILTKSGQYTGSYGTLYVQEDCDDGRPFAAETGCVQLGGVHTLPVCVRTAVPGDRAPVSILCAGAAAAVTVFSLPRGPQCARAQRSCLIFYTERSL